MDAWIRTVSFDSQSHHLATTERFYSSFLLGLLTMPSSISSGLLLCQFHLFSDWEEVPNKASRMYLPLCLSWFHLNEQFVCGLWALWSILHTYHVNESSLEPCRTLCLWLPGWLSSRSWVAKSETASIPLTVSNPQLGFLLGVKQPSSYWEHPTTISGSYLKDLAKTRHLKCCSAALQRAVILHSPHLWSQLLGGLHLL